MFFNLITIFIARLYLCVVSGAQSDNNKHSHWTDGSNVKDRSDVETDQPPGRKIDWTNPTNEMIVSFSVDWLEPSSRFWWWLFSVNYSTVKRVESWTICLCGAFWQWAESFIYFFSKLFNWLKQVRRPSWSKTSRPFHSIEKLNFHASPHCRSFSFTRSPLKPTS